MECWHHLCPALGAARLFLGRVLADGSSQAPHLVYFIACFPGCVCHRSLLRAEPGGSSHSAEAPGTEH